MHAYEWENKFKKRVLRDSSFFASFLSLFCFFPFQAAIS